MQSSSFSRAVFDAAAAPSEFADINLAMNDLGAPAPRGSRAAGAPFAAPVAMLIGAIGLLGLWVAAPKHQILSAPAPQTAAESPTALQSDAVAQAALRDDQALRHLLVDLGAPVNLVRPPAMSLTATAAQTVNSLHDAEMTLISAADLDARARLEAMQDTFRQTGLDARAYMAPSSVNAAQAHPALSPLELRDPKVLAARLDLDPEMAKRLQLTARRLTAARILADAQAALPLSTPVDDPVRSSPFGTRIDPFTHLEAFHPGQDFSGYRGQAIHVTAPGVVSFVGQRSGYGNCVEVDHGHGFKTRYGHLEAVESRVGESVRAGDVIGLMGSTGRSTGVHLHYEVWASGRLQDPTRFLLFPEGTSLPG